MKTMGGPQTTWPVESPDEGKTRLESLLSGEAAVEPEVPVSQESEVRSESNKRIDVSGWSLEQVHDALARHARDGWELSQVIEADTGRMVLWLVNGKVA